MGSRLTSGSETHPLNVPCFQFGSRLSQLGSQALDKGLQLACVDRHLDDLILGLYELKAQLCVLHGEFEKGKVGSSPALTPHPAL